MNLAALLALLSLTLTDATGDAIGDGTLDPPTAPLYANLAVFDLQAVDLQVADDGSAVLSVTMGALGPAATGAASEAPGPDEEASPEGAAAAADTPPADAAELSPEEAAAALTAEADQFDISGLLAVIDVYLDTGVDGAEQTLRGPNMVFPVGSSWRNAVRISAEGAWGVTYVGAAAAAPDAAGDVAAVEADGSADNDAAPTLEGQADAAGTDGEAGAAAMEDEADAVLDLVPLEVSRRGNVLSMTLPWTFEPEGSIDVYAVTGVHDPFSPDAWRPIAAASSPWAFSGGEQVAPVIDLLAPDAEAQTAALRTGVLPAPARDSGMTLPLSPWLWLMVGGLAVALFGLVLRGRVGRPVADATAAADDAPEAVAADELPDEPQDIVATLLPFDAEDEAEDGEEDATEEDVTEEDATEEDAAEDDDDIDALVERHDIGAVDEVSAAPEPVTPEATAPEPAADAEDTPAIVLPEEPELEVEDEAPAPAARDRSTYSTSADASYLGSDDDEDDLLFGHANDAGESFWHPASRTKKTLVPSSSSEPSSPGVQPDGNERSTNRPDSSEE